MRQCSNESPSGSLEFHAINGVTFPQLRSPRQVATIGLSPKGTLRQNHRGHCAHSPASSLIPLVSIGFRIMAVPMMELKARGLLGDHHSNILVTTVNTLAALSTDSDKWSWRWNSVSTFRTSDNHSCPIQSGSGKSPFGILLPKNPLSTLKPRRRASVHMTKP